MLYLTDLDLKKEKKKHTALLLLADDFSSYDLVDRQYRSAKRDSYQLLLWRFVLHVVDH